MIKRCGSCVNKEVGKKNRRTVELSGEIQNILVLITTIIVLHKSDIYKILLRAIFLLKILTTLNHPCDF